MDEIVNFMISGQNFEDNSWEKILEKISKLNPKMIAEVEEKLQLTFVLKKEDGNLCYINNNEELQDAYKQTFTPVDLSNYIYSVLCTPQHKDKYKEILKIDLSRFPYPKKTEDFWKLVKLGGEIRTIHLLKNPVIEKFITQNPIDSDNVVENLRFVIPPQQQYPNDTERGEMLRQAQHDAVGKVYINDTQYFDNVPEVAWNFNIRGYQPAQKWLKDRKGKTLKIEDIEHYQKIIDALFQTYRLIKEINKIELIKD